MISTLVPVQQTYPLPMPDNPTSITDWLEQFGSMSPDEIARYLWGVGVRGTRGTAGDCGFAVFFRRMSKLRHLRVDGTGIYTGIQFYPLPASCRAFVRRFDRGNYPWLYRENTLRYVADLIKGEPISFELPANFWDELGAKFKSIEDAYTLTYYVPVPMITPLPVKAPELVGV